MQVEIHYTWIPWDKFREPVRNLNMDHIGYCHMYIYICYIYVYRYELFLKLPSGGIFSSGITIVYWEFSFHDKVIS